MSRVALVSGGGRGIGRATVLALAAAGIDVAVNYRRDQQAADDTVAAAEQAGVRARAYRAEVESAEQDETMVAQVLADFGAVDILVHCAGIASRGHAVSDTDPAEPARVFAVHALAGHHLSRLVLPSMRTRPRGDIVMISSIATEVLRPLGAPYNMAKAALEALAMTLAKEERVHGIRVNVVAPGLVATTMGSKLVRATMDVEHIEDLDARAPFGRVCRPEDIAGVVRMLVSEDCGYVTGQRIAVDGGETWGWES